MEASLTVSSSGTRPNSELIETMICKECQCIIDQDDIVAWTRPSSSTKVAVLIGHPPNTAHDSICKTGAVKRYEDYSVGALFININKIVFHHFNYLGKLNYYELPIDFVYIVDITCPTSIHRFPFIDPFIDIHSSISIYRYPFIDPFIDIHSSIYL